MAYLKFKVALHMVYISGKNSCFFKFTPEEERNHYLCLLSGAVIALVSSSQISANFWYTRCLVLTLSIKISRFRAQGIIGEANISAVGGSVQADC